VELAGQIRQQMAVDAALDDFKRDYPEIAGDATLHEIAGKQFDYLTQQGMPVIEAIAQAGADTRAWLAAKAGVEAPKPNASDARQQKIEHKARRDPPSGVGGRAPTNRQAPRSAFDVVEDMIAARQLPNR